MPASLEFKKLLLKTLFEAYDEAARGFASACSRECRSCCTHNVVGTTLEAEMMLAHLEEAGRADSIQAVEGTEQARRLRPSLSINALALCCLNRKEPPQEAAEFDIEPCPLRGEDGCPCYEVRPLSCRCLWSEELCAPNGEAILDPLLVTLNGVFQQIAEDIDAGGLYGNIFDLLLLLKDSEVRSACRTGLPLRPSVALWRSIPNPGLLVPPEHRKPVLLALSRLWEKRVGDSTFREAMQKARFGAKYSSGQNF